jgi:glycerate kinase
VADGIRRVWPDASGRVVPMAAGGEGTLAARSRANCSAESASSPFASAIARSSGASRSYSDR